jgi:hypothetical protein
MKFTNYIKLKEAQPAAPAGNPPPPPKAGTAGNPPPAAPAQPSPYDVAAKTVQTMQGNIEKEFLNAKVDPQLAKTLANAAAQAMTTTVTNLSKKQPAAAPAK